MRVVRSSVAWCGEAWRSVAWCSENIKYGKSFKVEFCGESSGTFPEVVMG